MNFESVLKSGSTQEVVVKQRYQKMASISQKCGQFAQIELKFDPNAKEKDLKNSRKIRDPLATKNLRLDNHKCKICAKNYSSFHSLKSHVKIVHLGVKDFECDKCKLKIGYANDLRRHKLICGIKREKKSLDCMKCDKQYKTRSGYYSHMTIFHGSGKHYKCEKCQKMFGYSNDRRRHQLICGRKREKKVKSLECKICDKQFKSTSGYYGHMKIVHRDGKKFQCEKCQRQFGYSKDLQRHIQICGREKKPKSTDCDICGKNFTCRRNLVAHVEVVHEGLKKFMCDKCSQTFGYPNDLRRHKLFICGKEKRGKSTPTCTICKRVFKRKDRLNAHILAIHEGHRFQCETCGKTYSYVEDFKKHIAAAHNLTKVKKEEAIETVKDEAKDPTVLCALRGNEFADEESLQIHETVIHV